MAGQIVKRGEGVFVVRIFVGRDAEGRRKYQNQTVRGTKKDAQTVLNALLRDKDLGTLVQPTRKGFGEHAESWLETVVKPRVRNRTFIDYESMMRRYLMPNFGALPLGQITTELIQKHYFSMQKRGLSAQTVRHTHAVLNNIMKQAVRWRLVNANPCDHVDLPQVKRVEMKALDQSQATRFLEQAKKTEHFALFALLLTTGMRPGEALALRWCDIQLDRQTLSITRALSGRSGNYRFEEPKTPKSRRTVPISTTVCNALRDLRSRAEKEADGSLIDLQLVFANRTGGALDLQNLNKREFKPILRAAGLDPSIRLYDLRHSCATLLLEGGVHVKVVSERLGHASAMQTLDRYSHVVPGLQESATVQLESMLFGTGS